MEGRYNSSSSPFSEPAYGVVMARSKSMIVTVTDAVQKTFTRLRASSLRKG
jgi:hypothetical protein